MLIVGTGVRLGHPLVVCSFVGAVLLAWGTRGCPRPLEETGDSLKGGSADGRGDLFFRAEREAQKIFGGLGRLAAPSHAVQNRLTDAVKDARYGLPRLASAACKTWSGRRCLKMCMGDLGLLGPVRRTTAQEVEE